MSPARSLPTAHWCSLSHGVPRNEGGTSGTEGRTDRPSTAMPGRVTALPRILLKMGGVSGAPRREATLRGHAEGHAEGHAGDGDGDGLHPLPYPKLPSIISS